MKSSKCVTDQVGGNSDGDVSNAQFSINLFSSGLTRHNSVKNC